MTTTAPAAAPCDDIEKFGAGVDLDMGARSSSVEQAMRYVEEQLETLHRLALAVTERLAPVLVPDATDLELASRDRLPPPARSEHAVAVADLGNRLADLVDSYRALLNRLDF